MEDTVIHKKKRKTQWLKIIEDQKNSELFISEYCQQHDISPKWLFSNTPRDAEASMILYSLMITAKENGLNPFRYLRDTLNKLPSVSCADDLEGLLPLRKISSDLNEG